VLKSAEGEGADERDESAGDDQGCEEDGDFAGHAFQVCMRGAIRIRALC
jgi:hypothetical protein